MKFKASVEKLEKGWNVKIYQSKLSEAQDLIAELFKRNRDLENAPETSADAS